MKIFDWFRRLNLFSSSVYYYNDRLATEKERIRMEAAFKKMQDACDKINESFREMTSHE